MGRAHGQKRTVRNYRLPDFQVLFSLPPRSGPVAAVERAVLDGFRDVRIADVLRRVQIRNGARHFQNAIVSAGAEAQAVHSAFQQPLAIRRNVAVLADLPRAHLRVAVYFLSVEPLQLTFPRLDDAGANGTVDDALKMINGITLPELLGKVTSCDIHPYAFIEHQYPSTDEERKAAQEGCQCEEFGTTPEIMKQAIETSRKG